MVSLALIDAAKLFSIQMSEDSAVTLAIWILNAYPCEQLQLVIATIKNPPQLDNPVWKINPDTVTGWMTIALERQADQREKQIHNAKQDEKDFEVNYEAFRRRLEKEREERNDKAELEREQRIQRLQGLGQFQSTEEEIVLKQLRIEWSRQYHHADRLPPNNKKDNWLPFEEFIKLKSAK